MTAAQLAPERRIQVFVSAGDPISRDGVASQLRGLGVDIVDRAHLSAAVVGMVVADEVDEAAAREVRSIRRAGAGKVVLVATRLDVTGVMTAVEAGTTAILRRQNATRQALGAALRTAEPGEPPATSDLLAGLLQNVGDLRRTASSPRGLMFQGLTQRELQLLRLLAEGMATAEVGRQLHLSERTVKNVVHDIATKLNVRNRAHAVAYALREGWI
jgi:DNA-binding NarL/FixJ family response regulator